jgi:hypothetical protein
VNFSNPAEVGHSSVADHENKHNSLPVNSIKSLFPALAAGQQNVQN